MQSFVEGYGFKLSASYIPPQKCSTLMPGIAIKNSATSQHSLSIPLKDADITVIKQLSQLYSDTHGTGKGQNYYLPADALLIRNPEFTELVKDKINEIITKFCENLDPIAIEVKLLGARLIDSTCGGADEVRDGPTVSDQSSECFCATVCIQVRFIFYLY